MFSSFYHARPKIALISGVRRMEIQMMATLGSLVVHHWVIFPSLLLIQNALGGWGLANSVDTNALVTIFVQKSITTFTRPMEDKGWRLSPHLVILRHWSKESWEEWLQSIWWRNTSTCKGNTLNWRRCGNVATTPLECVHQKKRRCKESRCNKTPQE